MRNCNLLRLLTLSGFLSLAVLPRHAAAQWPTLDISSVKEGISTNIELVKQSKVVTDAMATAGKINAGIGDAKASVSKFAGDNLAKAQEKMKKLQEEKERIEKKKEEYEKIKKEIEEKKEAMEDYKRQAEALKADAEGYIADAKEMKDAASDVVSTVKDDVSSASSSAGISSGNADLNTTSAVRRGANRKRPYPAGRLSALLSPNQDIRLLRRLPMPKITVKPFLKLLPLPEFRKLPKMTQLKRMFRRLPKNSRD